MKNKALIRLIASATIGTTLATPAIINNKNTTPFVNKVLMVNNTNSSSTNEAVVINGNSSMNLYALSNGIGIVSRISTGEMLTILGQAQNGYCKVKVQETGAVGYINIANMQNIFNGTNDTFTQLSGNGQVVNVSSNVRLRSNPSIGNNNIIGHLTNGTNLNILGKQGQWYKVSINGQIGFIYEEYVSMSMINNISANSGKHNISATNLENSKSVSTINLDNSNTLTTSSKISNSTSTTNLKNHAKNIVVKSKNSVISNSLQNKNNTNNIVYTDPRQTTFIQTAATSSSQNLQVIKNKVVKLKVLEKLYGTAPGTQNPTPIWYKVELPNGIIGYIAQSETYYKIISTNPNKNIPVFEGPDTSTIIIGSINHKKESLYVISSVITSSPMNSMKTRYYKVRTLNGEIGFIPCSYI